MFAYFIAVFDARMKIKDNEKSERTEKVRDLLVNRREKIVARCIFRRLARRRSRIGCMRIDGIKEAYPWNARESLISKAGIQDKENMYVCT